MQHFSCCDQIFHRAVRVNASLGARRSTSRMPQRVRRLWRTDQTTPRRIRVWIVRLTASFPDLGSGVRAEQMLAAEFGHTYHDATDRSAFHKLPLSRGIVPKTRLVPHQDGSAELAVETLDELLPDRQYSRHRGLRSNSSTLLPRSTVSHAGQISRSATWR
jgi:hypothetical protein